MLPQLQDIFREVFNDGNLIIGLNTSHDNFQKWDSLSHLELIAAIEENLNIVFTLDEVLAAKNVSTLIEMIQLKQTK
jgi:acyl carrier protein